MKCEYLEKVEGHVSAIFILLSFQISLVDYCSSSIIQVLMPPIRPS